MTEADGVTSVQIDGISVELRGATAQRSSQQTLTLRLPEEP